jgi:hypothetical protein
LVRYKTPCLIVHLVLKNDVKRDRVEYVCNLSCPGGRDRRIKVQGLSPGKNLITYPKITVAKKGHGFENLPIGIRP